MSQLAHFEFKPKILLLVIPLAINSEVCKPSRGWASIDTPTGTRQQATQKPVSPQATWKAMNLIILLILLLVILLATQVVSQSP